MTLAANGAFARASASFLLVVVHADGCPARLDLGSVSIRACLGMDAGFVRAEGTAYPHSQVASPPWFDLTALGRVRWMSRWLTFIEVEGGLVVPFNRPDFAIATLDAPPGAAPTRVYQVPPASGVASLGAGVHFR